MCCTMQHIAKLSRICATGIVPEQTICAAKFASPLCPCLWVQGLQCSLRLGGKCMSCSTEKVSWGCPRSDWRACYQEDTRGVLLGKRQFAIRGGRLGCAIRRTPRACYQGVRMPRVCNQVDAWGVLSESGGRPGSAIRTSRACYQPRACYQEEA